MSTFRSKKDGLVTKILELNVTIFIFYFMCNLNVNNYGNCSSEEASINSDVLENDTKADETSEVDDELVRILEDLDRCIGIRSTLNDSNYLAVCLETEISSIIYKVINPAEKIDELSGNHRQFDENSSEIVNVSHTSTKPENVSLTENKNLSTKVSSDAGQTELFERKVHSHNTNESKNFIKDIPLNHKVNSNLFSNNVSRHLGKRDLHDTPGSQRNALTAGKRSDKNLQIIVDPLKRPVNINRTNLTVNPFEKTYKIELGNSYNLKDTYFDGKNEKMIEYSDPLVNEIQDDTDIMDFRAQVKKLWQKNNIKHLKELLENVRNYLEDMKFETTEELKNESENEKEVEKVADGTVVNIVKNTVTKLEHSKETLEDFKHNRQPKQQNYIERKPRSSVDIIKTLVNDFFQLKMVRYGLDKIKDFSRSLNDYGTASILWNILRTGYTIATSARGKKDYKPQVMSGLIVLGVVVPTLFSVVALMAKKALISSLVALALAIYAVTQSKGEKGKQNYELEGPLASGSKYSEFKSNSGTSSNIEFPNIENIPVPNIPNSPHSQQSQNSYQSYPYDDTKYFNRPSKQQESEFKNIQTVDTTGQRMRKPNPDTREQHDYHDYTQNQPESNSYEVTERNEVIKNRRPTRPDNRYKFVLNDEDFKTSSVTETFKPNTNDDNEDNYRNANYPKRQSHEETTRHGKGNEYRTSYPSTRQQSAQISKRPKYNTYKNSDSYRSESNRIFRGTNDNAEVFDQNTASSERNLKTNKNYSSKVPNENIDKLIATDFSDNFNKHTTEQLPAENTFKIEPPPTEKNVYKNSHTKTVYDDGDYSENGFKPMIVTTQGPKTHKSTMTYGNDMESNDYNRVTEKSEDADKAKDRPSPVNQYFNEEDQLLYQNLDEHEFRRPSPVYKPYDSQTKSGLTLSYIPKIKSFTNTSIESMDQ